MVSDVAQWQYDFQQYLDHYLPWPNAPDKNRKMIKAAGGENTASFNLVRQTKMECVFNTYVREK